MRYTVHTTNLRDFTLTTINRRFSVTTHVEADCFYGFGELIDSPTCEPHVQFVTLDRDTALGIAQHLYANDYQVVVTWSENWSVPLLSLPIRYSANHQH